ncbi:MAG: LysM peptidoglycan-binding domain-containing protein [Verrucomicrobiaceae bacterium]|nr:LysM peptidoglycan-binding domain-containing protein [Verrucomicrobiaceae bacterium]
MRKGGQARDGPLEWQEKKTRAGAGRKTLSRLSSHAASSLENPTSSRIMTPRMTKTARFLTFAACLSLVGCQNPNDPAANVSDPYASNYNDGFYNPYPGQGGTMQRGSSQPSYQTPPPAENVAEQPPPPDPYAFGKPSSGSSTTSSKPKTVASSSSKKPTTSSSKSKSTSSASKSKSKSSSGSRHTVAKGDTLYGIALKKKTTVAKIKAANGLKSDLIRPGQTLKIP